MFRQSRLVFRTGIGVYISIIPYGRKETRLVHSQRSTKAGNLLQLWIPEMMPSFDSFLRGHFPSSFVAVLSTPRIAAVSFVYAADTTNIARHILDKPQYCPSIPCTKTEGFVIAVANNRSARLGHSSAKTCNQFISSIQY